MSFLRNAVCHVDECVVDYYILYVMELFCTLLPLLTQLHNTLCLVTDHIIDSG